jgi:hypothetical protein
MEVVKNQAGDWLSTYLTTLIYLIFHI